MTKLNKTCEDFLECSTQFKCGGTTKDVENIDEAVSYCHVVAFHVSPGYLDCIGKVDTKNFTCVQGWNPFPDFEGTEEEKMRKQKEACRNFFGKDGCLEKEISDMCSVELWKDFRKILKHLVELVSSTPDYKKIGNDVIKDCNAFRECSTIVKCVNNASFENIIEMLYNNCDAAEYFIKDFPKCDDKLEGLNSTCLEEWNPFKDTPINETFVELPDEQKVFCEDYYGKDDCVKNHIVETCGEKEFEIFHKHQKNVVKIVGDCRLE
ncbi:Protein CBG00756 [Caenorhabditis briggsae]|uniref:Protein CBG00756 n=1 Tax=Caenorhabditis briggsae TaxID=6238 RepID=A8WNR6_CAEBR|nr:Protein CBG00756 [Caenorhabditis briggsae]CAP22122.1 Protein CBG00756 [Caenorhabditis briggsae]